MRRTSTAVLGIATLVLAALSVAPVGAAAGAPVPGAVPNGATLVATGTPLSDTVVSGGHTLTYLLGGGAVPGTGAWAAYDAVVLGGRNVTFVGAISYSLESGYSTLLTQRAGLSGTKGVLGYDGEYVGGGTYSTPFNLIAVAPKVEGVGVVRTMYAEVSSRNCNYYGVCGGPSVDLTIGVLGTGTDVKPPTIEVLAPKGSTRIGETTKMRFVVKDNRKKARVFATMFSDGTAVSSGKSPLLPAVGDVQSATWQYPREGTGPFYECVWAKDKAGNVSKGAPYSSCRWLTIQVKVPRVSNGCGGSAWGDEAADLMNWFGDTRTYGDQTVSFRAACNQHDAGYDGATVAGLGTRTLTDFRTWSREEVDIRFGQDLMRQCNLTLPGPKYAEERAACHEEIPIYLGLVREYGAASFDADVTTHGEQTVKPSSTLPAGGARDNG